MYNLTSGPLDADETNNQMTNPDMEQSLEGAEPVSLMRRSGAADYRTELYARLRNIIDNATESIRALKEENVALAGQNAELSDRIGTLEYRIRAVTTDLANDEMALRRSAEVLEQVLKSTPLPPARPRDTTAPAEQSASHPQSPMSVVPATEPPIMQEDEAALQPMEPMQPAPEAHADDATPEPHEQIAEAMPEADVMAEAPAEMAEPVATAAPEQEMEAETPEATEAPMESAPVARTASSPEGTYVLVASPFVRFSDLGQFQSSLQRLTGIHDVQVRRFAQGTLEMRLGYDGASDLMAALRNLAVDIEDVQEEEPYRLRVRLRTPQDA